MLAVRRVQEEVVVGEQLRPLLDVGGGQARLARPGDAEEGQGAATAGDGARVQDQPAVEGDEVGDELVDDQVPPRGLGQVVGDDAHRSGRRIDGEVEEARVAEQVGAAGPGGLPAEDLTVGVQDVGEGFERAVAAQVRGGSRSTGGPPRPEPRAARGADPPRRG